MLYTLFKNSVYILPTPNFSAFSILFPFPKSKVSSQQILNLSELNKGINSKSIDSTKSKLLGLVTSKV